MRGALFRAAASAWLMQGPSAAALPPEAPPARAVASARIATSRDVHLSLQGMGSTLRVAGASVSNFATKATLDYFVHPNVALGGAYCSMQTSTGATLLGGFEASVKWYPIYPGTEMRYVRDDLSIRAFSNFSPYALVGYRLRTLYFETSQISVGGLGYAAGFDWYPGRIYLKSAWAQPLFLNGEAAFDMLSSTKNTAATVVSFAAGIGIGI